MRWRFTIIDRLGTGHVINEPEGWADIKIDIVRDIEKHGVFFDYQSNDFGFDGLSYRLLKEEYEQYGIQGKAVLVIEEACDDDFEELYRGDIIFGEYDKTTGSECYINAPMATTGEVVEIKNRLDQTVDLLSTKAFDQVTDLVPYDKIGFPLTLPSKGIFIKNEAVNAARNGTPIGPPDDNYGMISIGFDTTKSAEIGSFQTDPSPLFESVDSLTLPASTGGSDDLPVYIWPLSLSPVLNFSKDSPNYGAVNERVKTEYRIKGTLTSHNATLNAIHVIFCRLPESAVGETNADYEFLDTQEIFNHNPLIGPPAHAPLTLDFDCSFVNTDVAVLKGDRFYLFLSVRFLYNSGASHEEAFDVVYDTETFFRMETLSKTESSECSVCMINEAFSRVVESISNDKVRLYSEYLGRTDSQPYSHASNGCGSMEVITKGLFVRRQENRNGQTAIMGASMKDIFDGLNPIHNIGYGFENDPNRAGYLRLRVEPWKFFYKDAVIMECLGIDKIKLSVQEKEHYSTLQVGYEKWEAEEYNGLDEFLTKRSFRTTLSQVKNELIKYSKFIASGYAWEITRRKGDLDSKDWRYDNDIFIACVKKGSTQSVEIKFNSGNSFRIKKQSSHIYAGAEIYLSGNPLNTGTFNVVSVVESGLEYLVTVVEATVSDSYSVVTVNNQLIIGVEQGNVSNPSNIIDPDTIYNWRIRPAYNAMRWMDVIFASYRQPGAGNKIIFMNGDGNYFASGEMTSSTCKIENQVIAENDSISSALFANALKAAAIKRPERVEYEYPMSTKRFKIIKANPFGTIYYSDGFTEGYGWINNINYRPNEGKATFSLIPKYQ